MLVTPEAGIKVAGRYLLQETVGKGGMGVVWRAWDERLERQVAVKFAHPDDDRATQQLMKEARNAGRLHHANIVGVFDCDHDADTCWIVMEYVPARSLGQIVAERGLLPPDEAGAIGCQIAAALMKSHSAGVVHGDVTPENILVTDEGIARLTDFGISRAMWSETTRTTTGVVRGKPRYLAPELVRGKRGDEKSDVFSLGATLYTAVEGQSPYGQAEHPMAYVARAMEGHIEPAVRAGLLSGPLAALLEVEPRDRPDAAGAYELLTRAAPPPPEITAKLRGARTLPLGPLPSVTRRLPRAVRRRGRPLALASGALLAAAAVTAAVLHPWTADGDRRTHAEAKPPATATAGRPGTVGDAATADPCGLPDAASLSRFGATHLDAAYGEFNRCDVVAEAGNGDELADLELELDNTPAQFEGDVPTRRVGNVTVGSYARDGDECERHIATADHEQIVIVGKRRAAGAPDPCALADAGTDVAVGVLDRGKVPRRAAPVAAASLARLDACSLLDSSALRKVGGVGTREPERGFGNWHCAWSSSGDESGVDLLFNRDNELSDDGRPARVAGTTSYVSPGGSGAHSCVVRTPHRTYPTAAGDDITEFTELTVYAPQPAGRLCGTAEKLSATVVHELAKQLPENK
ncbi:serine/threonine-protein kinase [Streptomyces sp. NBC_00859]|uniref:serine/threonine-protein kinase n=1 Tax=Streptomyces sp. NBC_00859 TaxID=2903682 RepID=UPI00386DC6D9|nr:serine/threonine protein kinase [Streptomyces sp. NBC_00859]